MRKILLALLLVLCLLPCVGSAAFEAAEEYGYEQLGALPQGDALQSFYRTLQKTVTEFGESGGDAPEDLVIASYSTEDTGLTADQMGVAFASLELDHPEYYWISVDSATEYSQGLEIRTMPECRTAESRQEIGLAVTAAADRMTEEIREKTAGADTMTVAEVTHDILLDAIEYELDSPMCHTIAGAFWSGRGVCNAYAKAYKYLLQRQGIFSLVVNGDAGEPHAWVYVQNGEDGFFYVDPTWDDRTIDGSRRGYFNLPEDAFLQTHKPGLCDIGEGLLYCYPLPASSKEKPAYQVLEGIWLDETARVSETAGFAEAFETLVPLCREAALGGKSAFALHASSAEAENLMQILPYLAIRMQDEADLADIFADLTETSYNGNILTVGITLYEPDTAPKDITAYADGKLLGRFVTVSQAFAACEGQEIETLELVLREYRHFYLPENQAVPAVKKLILRNSDMERDVLALDLWTLRGWTPGCDVELCRLSLHQMQPMNLDLAGHELILAGRVILGSYNFDPSGDKSAESFLTCRQLTAKGTGYIDVCCNVTAEEVLLDDAYRVVFRGSGVLVRISRCVARNEGEFLPTGIGIGIDPSVDSVDAEIGELVIEKNALFVMGPAPGKQRLLLGSVDNAGEWNLSFHIAKLDGQGGSEFILPEIEIPGAFRTLAQLELQYITDRTYKEVGVLFPEGTPLLKVPQGQDADWHVSVSISSSHDSPGDMDSGEYSGGLYDVTFDEDGVMYLGKKKY